MVGVRVQQAEQQLLERPTAWAGCHTQDHDPVTIQNPLPYVSKSESCCAGVGQWEVPSAVFLSRPALILAEVS